MATTEYVGVRLPKKDIKIIEEKAREETTDKSTALRELLEQGIKQYRMEKAIQKYMVKQISLEKAAEIAGVSVGEMMDILIERGIPSHLTIADAREGLNNIERIFGIKLD